LRAESLRDVGLLIVASTESFWFGRIVVEARDLYRKAHSSNAPF
jgi:hypothetical protein